MYSPRGEFINWTIKIWDQNLGFNTYHSSLSNCIMLHQCTLNLCCAQQVTSHIHTVISPTSDPIVAFTVTLTAYDEDQAHQQIKHITEFPETQSTGIHEVLNGWCVMHVKPSSKGLSSSHPQSDSKRRDWEWSCCIAIECLLKLVIIKVLLLKLKGLLTRWEQINLILISSVKGLTLEMSALKSLYCVQMNYLMCDKTTHLFLLPSDTAPPFL